MNLTAFLARLAPKPEITLRDEVALRVLPSLMAEPSRQTHTARMLACAAYEVADAMLEVRQE